MKVLDPAIRRADQTIKKPGLLRPGLCLSVAGIAITFATVSGMDIGCLCGKKAGLCRPEIPGRAGVGYLSGPGSEGDWVSIINKNPAISCGAYVVSNRSVNLFYSITCPAIGLVLYETKPILCFNMFTYRAHCFKFLLCKDGNIFLIAPNFSQTIFFADYEVFRKLPIATTCEGFL